ncbi:general substrate transporter [Aspergillus karnatakaensis]|uniref:general substrate transporter n=1 Tax=Aspergillus karnatakaensis TaxID=1810916 RepID=UPI003CCDE23B
MAPEIQPEKPTAVASEHQETVNDEPTAATKVGAEAAARGQGTTGYEGLSVWETVMMFKMNALICFMVTFSAATDGYQIGMIGNIVANPGFIKKFGTDVSENGEVALASSVMSTWAALGSLGQIIGMTTLPFLSDRFGRKPAMYTFWFILALSIMTECVAQDWRGWLAAKMVGGIGVGCLQSTIPIYISEVAPIRVRGAFLMCYSLWFITGQFFAPVALQVLSTSDPENYLTPIYTQWSQIGLMLIIYFFVPESPAWCASKGKEAKAKKVLSFIYKGVKDFNADHHYQLLVMNIEHERAVAAEQRNEKWYSIFKGTDGIRTLVSLWTLMAQCFIGLGVFLSNASYFFQQAGLEDPFQVTCITSGINIFFSFVVIYLADTTGRRWLACSGTTICWAANVAVGILGVIPQGKATNYLLVLFSCIWNIGLVANGATGWGFIGEVSSQRLRPYTAGFAAASTCVMGIGMGVLIPYMLNTNQWNWGLKTCWFFAGVGLPFTIGMWFLIPETAGRSAAELDELFERKIKPWRFHKTTTMTQRLVEAKNVA